MHLRWTIRFGFALWVSWLAGCSREPSPGAAAPPVPATAAPVPTSIAVAETDGFEEVLPRVGKVPGYIGSEACRECHADQHASWHRSYHRTMTQLAAPGAVQAKFDGVVLTNDNTRFTLGQRSNEFWVRMEKVVVPGPESAAPEAVEARLGLVTGSHHMQVFWVPNGAGNTQVGFPFTWLIPEQRWVPRNSTFIRPPDMVHRSEVWNIVCNRCHTTGPEPHMDRANRSFDTRVAEFGISCEACHGPADRHTAIEQAAKNAGKDTKVPGFDHGIIQPEKLDPKRSAQVCAFCHSMKWYDGNEGWSQNGFRYRPGDDLEATTPIIRPRRIDRQPWLQKVLAGNPDLMRDFFWPDGMIRVSGREHNGLIESPCYAGGKFTCISCHSLHSGEPDDQLAKNRSGNRSCTQCHEPLRDPAKLTAHTHHADGSSGSDCQNCHMPHTTYGVLKAIRSHEISSPRVAVELATGRPNACNLCHLDRTLGWTAGHLEKWYRQPAPKLTEEQAQVADSVRLALSGDAGQRALIAWHLGWEPGLAASGKAWVAPVLAQLMEDPYAAVRCVAERSLKQSGDTPPPGYDHTVAPTSALGARDTIWGTWRGRLDAKTRGALPSATLVGGDGAPEMERRFGRLLENRDTQPIRLRE